MAAILPPLVDFSDAAFAFPPHPSTEPLSPHHRPDTPQLTLHDYHKFQQSPLLSDSPGSERRVRRRPSVANLAVTSAQAPTSPSTSPSAPPHFTHSLAHPSLLLSSLPPPPATPRPRPNTASPSLSSTVTTLQSTPTHTPVFRGGSHFEQRRVNERVELVEPIRTKRKFDSLKQAKRLPRRTAGGGGSERDGELWEVFAVVIAPTEGHQDLEESEDLSEESDEQPWLQPAPLFSQQIATGSEKRRAVHFETPNSTEEFHDEGALPDLRTATSPWPFEEKETTATSTYSLSKFQLPVPVGHDNWPGTFGYHTEPNSPSTPATLHYHGASFDVVNPHESLLLEGHTFETPAEIDGLLDDYFHTKTEVDEMAHDEAMGEESQSSLRLASDSSRHARVLYNDPDSARRHILNKQDEVTTPPEAVLNDSTNKSDVAKPVEEDGLASMPPQQPQPKPNTNPFRGLSSIARVMGFVPSNSSGQPDGEAAKSGDRHPFNNDAAFGDMKGNLSPSDSGQLRSQQGSLRRVTHCSDPFDLTISESGSHANLMTIGETMKENKSAENVPNIAQGVDTVDAPDAHEGAVSQAIYADQESDPTIKEIIGSYDYTRAPSSPEKDESVEDSPSIEHGRATPGINDKQPIPVAHLALPAQADSTTVIQQEDEIKTPDSAVAMPPAMPVPPTPGYGGGNIYTNCTELRSSDETYGETNQLLQITPKTPEEIYPRHPEVFYPPYPGPQGNPFVDGEYVVRSGTPYRPSDELSRSTATVIHRKRDSEVPPQFRFFDTDEERDAAQRPLPRSSSVYPFDNIFDDPAGDGESAWETEVSNAHHGEDSASYADTSACDPESRVSVGPDTFLQYASFPNKAPMPRAHPSQRTKFEAPPDAPADEEDNVRDTQKAISLLSDKIVIEAMASKDGSCPDFDKEQRRLDLEELERLRVSNPGAVREASEFLANRSLDKVKDLGSKAQTKLQKMKASKPDHKKENIFKRAKALGKRPASPRSDSDHRFLLGTPDSGMAPNNLAWDESEGDFVTVRSEKTPGIWSPFAENTTEQALRMPSPEVNSRNAIELGRLGKKSKGKRRVGSAMSCQFELREFKLQGGRKNTTPRGRGLTDAELLEREPGWSLKPKRFASSPLVNNISSSAQPDDANPTTTPSAAPQDPDIEMQPTLISGGIGQTQWQRELPYLETRKQISKRYALLCSIIPGLSVVYFFGGFDWIMRKKTNGAIRGMDRRTKRRALRLHCPLSLFFWLTIAVVVGTLVVVFKNIDINGNGGEGPCTEPLGGFGTGGAGNVCPPLAL